MSVTVSLKVCIRSFHVIVVLLKAFIIIIIIIIITISIIIIIKYFIFLTFLFLSFCSPTNCLLQIQGSTAFGIH